ncbi:ACT domain-containing protein [Metallosphaera tengchongensis]|uniref:UPF0237 protein GWK48_07575 n=1 Tax=Metallosphaera tengchongensis TaxID=1532350 RepID=A0A6N0NWJ7_9CREN|nr:ACT domain-containing protein [Metallosphaera tengchongensis]QKR00253.1 ACT domain-containing protein [Metallosphaera tengchongensis]
METAIVVVIGADKPGIVAGISSKLAERNVNIIDITQTVLRGIFTMIMVVDLDTGNVGIGKLREELQAKGKELGVEVLVYHGEVFKFMERV